jgi:murein lipoprotein
VGREGSPDYAESSGADVARRRADAPRRHFHDSSTHRVAMMQEADRPLYSGIPGQRRMGMFLTKKNLATARAVGVAILATAMFSGCATYRDEFATINSRLDQLDAKVQNAAQSAESANQSAQQANQRLDQIEGRVQKLESSPRRVPRG